jgi:hypothetical protein
MAYQWAEVLRIATGLLCLIVVMIGVRWQARAFRGDAATGNRRMGTAAGLAAVCLAGILAWCVLAMVDPKVNLPHTDATKLVAGVGALCLIFLAKTWLGPLLISAVASWAVYMLMQHGELQLLPIFEFAVRMVFNVVPQGATAVYATLTIAYAAFGALNPAWSEADPLP